MNNLVAWFDTEKISNFLKKVDTSQHSAPELLLSLSSLFKLSWRDDDLLFQERDRLKKVLQDHIKIFNHNFFTTKYNRGSLEIIKGKNPLNSVFGEDLIKECDVLIEFLNSSTCETEIEVVPMLNSENFFDKFDFLIVEFCDELINFLLILKSRKVLLLRLIQFENRPKKIEVIPVSEFNYPELIETINILVSIC
jgi:hypothetical protein